jgi:hypothetical protein
VALLANDGYGHGLRRGTQVSARLRFSVKDDGEHRERPAKHDWPVARPNLPKIPTEVFVMFKKQPQNITDSRIAVSGMSPCCSELLAWPLSGRHRRQERILLRYYFSPSNIIKNVYRCTSVFVAYTARLAAWSKGVLPGARVRGIGQLGRAIEVRRRMGWQNLRVADLEAARAAQGPAGYWRLSFELMETNCRKGRSARLASHTFENARGR